MVLCAAVLQEVDVSVSTQLRQALQQATGQRTVPQVRMDQDAAVATFPTAA
jgi:glutaredoxin